MSSKKTVKWKDIVRICSAHNIEIFQGKGGDKKLKGPDAAGEIRVMTITHACSDRPSQDVWIDYVKSFQNMYGITDEEVYGPQKKKGKK